jgi:hypothetical protein
MTDPIANAAAQLDAAPSSTEPSLLERAEEKIHALEEKIEHMIHPEAASEPQSGEGETVAASAEAAPSVTSDTTTATAVESAPTQAAGEQGNAAPAVVNAAQQETSLQESAPVASSEEASASSAGDLPNVAASPAAEQSASDTSSSASLASTALGTVEASVSEDRKRALAAVSKLRSHLWTFSTDAVQHLHRELDFLEAFVK